MAPTKLWISHSSVRSWPTPSPKGSRLTGKSETRRDSRTSSFLRRSPLNQIWRVHGIFGCRKRVQGHLATQRR